MDKFVKKMPADSKDATEPDKSKPKPIKKYSLYGEEI